MIYSTCTLNPAENEQVVEKFISQNLDFELEADVIGGFRAERGMITFVPFEHRSDGFFIAKIRRK